MKVDVFMKFYIGDYLRDTMHLKTVEHGAYLLLIFHYWINEAALPDDDEYLAVVAKLTQTEWQSVRKRIAKFFQIGTGTWSHKRIELQLADAKRTQCARKAAGQAGNDAKRKQRERKGNANGDANGDALRSQSESESLTKTEIQGASEDMPVELPPNFPKSEEAAKLASHAVGCPEDFAAQTWHKAKSRGGNDAKDVPIRYWASYLKTEWTYEQQRQHQDCESANKPNASGRRQNAFASRPDRNAGTTNEGDSAQYRGVGYVAGD